jgi:ATP-binding protein involved in chromosome partitioning
MNLLNIQDPTLGLTLEEMGLKLSIENQVVKLLAGFPTNALKKTMQPILESALPNKEILWDFFIKAHKTQIPGKGLRGVKNIIAIASGKGGVGKSTVAVNLAIALAKAGARVGILDADIYGPSIPLMLGKHEPVQVWEDRYLPVQAHGVYAMSIGYLTEGDQALIWRGPMLAKSLLQMLDITFWDNLDYLLIDLPPGTGDIQLSLVQKIPLSGAVIVTTPQNVATLDAEKAIKMFEKTGIDVLGIVENMSLHKCSACGHEDPIFGKDGAKELTQMYQVPLLGQLPLDSSIRSHCDIGQPTAILESPIAEIYMNTAMKLAIDLAKKPLNYADRFPDINVSSPEPSS